MNFLKQGLCLALLGAGLAAVPGIQASAAGTSTRAAGESLVQQMRNEAQGGVKLTTERATGKIGFVRVTGNGDLLPDRAGDSLKNAADKATAYVQRFGGAFGAGAGQLQQAGVSENQHGWTVRFTQSYQDVPVFGAMLKANVDKAGDLTSVNGYAAPGLNLSVTPRLSKSEAAARAIATVRATPPGDGAADLSGIKAGSNELMVYRMGAIKGDAGAAVLAYVVEVTNKANVRDMVFVDANTGKPVNRYSMVHDALDRELYEADADRNLTLAWEEGDAFPGSLNPDQQNLVATAGDSYWFYDNTFGYNSYDGEGAKMQTVNNDPAIQCPNANWNGQTTNYCDGVTSDDVVAHEWGHAYTEFTSGLIYQWQPGAMNEGYSDIWGETVDLINGRDDAGETNEARPVGQCSKYTRGPVELTINSPGSIAGPCEAAPAAFGPIFDDTGVTADVVVAQDDASDGSATNGCAPYDNAAAVSGNFAYVDRGVCTFGVKADNAEAAGATGIIVGNHTAGEAPFSMSGSADIYGVMIGVEDGAKIKSATETVNVTVKDIGTEETADTYRWLVSEKSEAFGGAIRDMWDPTCYGDPGKVSDAEYKCSTDDSGGVHGNSGVVNHAYSLLVDGGTYNGVTVGGTGLDKAAHIYWRTQESHLTPSSDFIDLADGLDASCTALIGQEIRALSTQPSTLGDVIAPITPADCASVMAASAAVELRREPTQCNFQPLLKKNAPKACGKGTKSDSIWKESFEDGLRGWKKTEEVVFPGARGFNWLATKQARNHPSRAAYAPDPSDAGDCSGTASDVSSRNSITSPKVKMPNRGFSSRLTFRHYLATEAGWDGGNVKIKIGRGNFESVPEDAFIFNAYNASMFTSAEGNTSPLEGQPGFTGTDGGSVYGSWGKTLINLEMLGVDKGERIRIRFDFGRDGCGGNDGWYVDNVKVLICKKKNNNRDLATKQ